MRPVTATQLRTIDETAGFDVDIPQELWDLVDGRANGNETNVVRQDWDMLADQELSLRGKGLEPRFSILDDNELDAFEALVKEANDFPTAQANARGVPDSELANFFDAEFGFKPDGTLVRPFSAETNVIDFDAYIKANENVQTTTLMEDLGLPPAEYSDPVEIDEFKAPDEPVVPERTNGIEEMGTDMLQEITDFEHVMAPFEIEEGRPLMEDVEAAGRVVGEDMGMWDALVGAVKGGAPVMGMNPGLSTTGLTKHDQYLQERLEDYRYRQRHEILWWEDKDVWVWIAGFWYMAHTVEFEGSYLTKMPVEKRWTTEVRLEYHYYDQGRLVKQQTKWLDPNSGSPPMKSTQSSTWMPLPLDIGYWKPGTDPYALWQQKASELIQGCNFRAAGSGNDFQYLRKEPLTMASRPGQVTLNYAANKYSTVAADTLMDCAWRVRPATESDTPTTDLWALQDAIQNERDRRYEEAVAAEQYDAQAQWEWLKSECARLADLTYGNPPLHDRLDFMSWGSRVEDVDEMALLVQEAEQWLEDQKPVDDLPFDFVEVELFPDEDAFDTLKDHTDALSRLYDKAREAMEWVPEGGDLYWDLVDATYLGWEDRERIKNAIRRAKAYKPKKDRDRDRPETQPPPKTQETVNELSPLIISVLDKPHPAETHYIDVTGDRRRLMKADSDESGSGYKDPPLDRLTDWFFEHPYNPDKMYDNLYGNGPSFNIQNVVQYCVNMYEFLTRFASHVQSGRFRGSTRFAGVPRNKFGRNTTVLAKYDTLDTEERNNLRWRKWRQVTILPALLKRAGSEKEVATICYDWLFNVNRREHPAAERYETGQRSQGIRMSSDDYGHLKPYVQPLVDIIGYRDQQAGKDFEAVYRAELARARSEKLPDPDASALDENNMAYQHLPDAYYLAASTLTWCGLSYDSYCLNNEATPRCGPDDKRYIPPVRFEDAEDLEAMRRTYQSDLPEFFREALAASDGTTLPAVPFDRLEATNEGRAAPKGIVVAENGAQADFTRSIDCLTMFLLPAHNSTSEEEKEDAERYARARVEQRIKEPPQVNRVLYGKEDMRTHQVWLAGYITRCEWLLEAYGLDDRESRKIESNEVVTDYVWNVLRDDDWSGKTPPSRVSNATVSSLYRIMKRMQNDVRVAKQWLAEFQAAPQGGAVPARVMGFAPDIPKPSQPKPQTRDVQARYYLKVGEQSWSTFPSYREAARFAGMEPDTVKLILAGNYTSRYNYEFRYLGGQVIGPKKGKSVMFRAEGDVDFTPYESISQCARETKVPKSTLLRALKKGKTYPHFDVYYQGLEATTSDSDSGDEQPIAKKKPLVGKPEQGPNLVEVDPPVKPPAPKTSRLPPQLPSPEPKAPDVPLPESDSDTEEAPFQRPKGWIVAKPVLVRETDEDEWVEYPSVGAAAEALGVDKAALYRVVRGQKTYLTIQAKHKEEVKTVAEAVEDDWDKNTDTAPPVVKPEVEPTGNFADAAEEIDAFLDAVEDKKDVKDTKPPFAPDATSKKEEPIDAAEPILGQEQIFVDVPKPPPPPIVVNDNRLVSDNFPDWRNFDDQTFATLPGIDIYRSRSRANTLVNVDLTAADLPQAELPFNGTSGAIDLTQLWEDMGPATIEPDPLSGLREDGPPEEKAETPDVQDRWDATPRRSARLKNKAAVTYTELTQAQYDRLDELKSEVVQNIMQWVPRQLKMVIYDEELEYFGRGDAYIHPAQFQAGRLQQTFLLPAEIMAYDVTEADAATKLALLEDMVDYFDAEMVSVQEKKVMSATWYQQVAIALMLKHTIRLIVNQQSLPVLLWQTGNDAFAGMDLREVNTRVLAACDWVREQYGAVWPELWPMPEYLPTRLMVQLNVMASVSMNECQDAAVTVQGLIGDDGAVGAKDLEVLPDEAPGVEFVPLVADPAEEPMIPGLEDEGGAAATEALPVRNIKERIREVLEDQITLRVKVDMPLPPNYPQPLPPAISPAQQDKGWDLKWAFGIALTIWLAYQMD